MMQHYFNLWLEVAFRRRELVSRVTLGVFGAILLLSLAWPPIYQATATVLVQDNRAQFLVSPTLPSAATNQPAVMVNPVSEEDLNSEQTLLTGRALIEQTLAELPSPHADLWAGRLRMLRDLMQLPAVGYRALHDAPEPDPIQRQAMAAQSSLSAWVVKRSNLLQLSFRSHDPRWAQRFVAALLNHYLDYHARLSQDPQAERFFQTQATLLQQRLSLAEQHLHAIEMQTGISNLSEQKQALLNDLENFQAGMRRNQAELAAAHERVASLQEQLNANPQRVTKETKVVQNLALQSIKPQVLALQTQRAELLTRYRPDSERIRDIDAQLKAAQAILTHENHTEIEESSTDINPAWETIDSDLAQAKVAAATLQASQQDMVQEITRYRSELSALTGDESSFEEATREVDVAKEAYLSYVRKSEEARAAGALNQSRILNVSIAEPPALPLRPLFPNLPLNLAVGALLGLGLGLGAAWWEEERDARIHTLAAIQRASGLPTVAMLPEGF